jgi:predicted DNA-binding transcriptional regulator YafY
VIGHDHRSGEIRTFAVDRIQAIELTELHFEVREEFDFDEIASGSFGVFSEPAVPVHIRFTPEWRGHVTERTWHESQRIEEHEDGHLDLYLEVGGTAELASWVLSFGSGAEVVEPTALREEVMAQLKAAIASYA